jgi:hypothetical protein
MFDVSHCCLFFLTFSVYIRSEFMLHQFEHAVLMRQLLRHDCKVGMPIFRLFRLLTRADPLQFYTASSILRLHTQFSEAFVYVFVSAVKSGRLL